MNMSNLFDLFLKLKTPKNEKSNYFNTIKIKKFTHRLAKNINNEAVILFDVKNQNRGLQAPNTKNLILKFNQNCEIKEGSKSDQKSFTTLRCKFNDQERIMLFLNIIQNLLKYMPNKPSDDEIINKLLEIIELFSEIKGTKDIIGLWGEVFLIYLSRNKEELIKAWHPKSSNRYDFMHYNEVIEVKTTTNNDRKHSFSYNQLIGKNKSKIIASILIRNEGNSKKSINQMKKEIFKVVKSNDLKYKFENLILKILDDKIELQNSEKYCIKFASENIQFYTSNTVPSINGHDDGVTQIKFVSDLSIAKKVKKKESKLLRVIYT